MPPLVPNPSSYQPTPSLYTKTNDGKAVALRVILKNSKKPHRSSSSTQLSSQSSHDKASTKKGLPRSASSSSFPSCTVAPQKPISMSNEEIIKKAFPKALPNPELVGQVAAALQKYGYGRTTLLATSLCCDEVNRDLEKDFSAYYGDHFTMGGLAGFPFGGLTSFKAMAHHIPDKGSCLIVYGPHVGIDRLGNLGTVDRRGRRNSGSCCGSAHSAANYVCAVHAGLKQVMSTASIGMDIEQHYVGQMLLPHAKRLKQAKEQAIELPKILFEVQHKLIDDIVKQGCGEVEGNGKIALLGGIQINTPKGQEDYFAPINFELRDNHGRVLNRFKDAFLDEPEILV